MTPEHKFTLLTTALTALPALVFTGAAAYWTWRRDQERIRVQKSPVYWRTQEGEDKGPPCNAGIVVTNLSLFPVRIAKLGFRMSGKRIFLFDRDRHKDKWPPEIASHARMVIYADEKEWRELEALGARDELMEWGFVAVAVTETGARFFSNRLSVGIMRQLRNARKATLRTLARGYSRACVAVPVRAAKR